MSEQEDPSTWILGDDDDDSISLEDLGTWVLGEDADPIPLDSLADVCGATLSLAEQARKSLYIYTRDLEPPLYDNVDFTQAVWELARRNRYSHVHILVRDSSRAVGQGHRLIQLAQRLSSYVHIRNPSRKYALGNEAFLVADNMGVIKRPSAERYEGYANFNAPLSARELTRCFRNAWEHARPDREIRRLHI